MSENPLKALAWPPKELIPLPVIGCVDSHAHLSANLFFGDLDEVLNHAREMGVQKILTIGTGLEGGEMWKAQVIAARHPDIFASLGIHPHDAAIVSRPSEYQALLARMEESLKGPGLVAIGEIGLDHHYSFSTPEDQERCFRDQVEIAKRLDLPIILHCREAFDRLVQLLEESGLPGKRILFHCFSEDRAAVERLRNLNPYISFAGTLTFKKADDLRAAARVVALDRILVETDSPYLAPTPYRGKRNEPALVTLVLRELAKIRGISVEEACAVTSANFSRFFYKVESRAKSR